MPAIVEGWIDKVLAPPWAFKFKNFGEITDIQLEILEIKKQ